MSYILEFPETALLDIKKHKKIGDRDKYLFSVFMGVLFDFRSSFNLGKLFQGQMELHNSLIKNLGYHLEINYL